MLFMLLIKLAFQKCENPLTLRYAPARPGHLHQRRVVTGEFDRRDEGASDDVGRLEAGCKSRSTPDFGFAFAFAFDPGPVAEPCVIFSNLDLPIRDKTIRMFAPFPTVALTSVGPTLKLSFAPPSRHPLVALPLEILNALRFTSSLGAAAYPYVRRIRTTFGDLRGMDISHLN